MLMMLLMMMLMMLIIVNDGTYDRLSHLKAERLIDGKPANLLGLNLLIDILLDCVEVGW